MASRRRHSSPFNQRKPSSPYSSVSSTTTLANGRSVTKTSGSASSIYNSGSGMVSRSVTSRGGRAESIAAVGFGLKEMVGETNDAPRPADNISVTIRFRPLSEREFRRGDEAVWYAEGDQIVRNVSNQSTMYAFDKVFGPSSITQEVYEVAAKPVVKSAMEGVNGTVFAYGVTSSGKTYTMHGDQNSPGIIPLAIRDVFSMIQDTPGREYLLRVSYLEIYNEIINDLLDPAGQNLRVREDAQGTYVEGMKEEVVLSPGHALSFIASGEAHRHVGSTNFNLLSSRSHTIFTLMIESSAHGDEYDGVVFSQLNLIDLAGSESSKTETTGLRRKEGSYINKSLLTLGTVIGKLSEGKASHIPYRDSKLTRLLQSSLSGHGCVSLICTITPASSNTEETHNALKFASRAKRIEINASRNKLIDEKSLIKKYQKEISTLKQELEQLRNGMIVGINPEELLNLKQQFEEGQVKMRSRLEEEEEAKAALMSRIQRLTKLILVSSKSTIPGSLNEMESDRQSTVNDGSFILGKKINEDSLFVGAEVLSDLSQRSSSSNGCDAMSPSVSLIAESTIETEVANASTSPAVEMTSADQLDLFVEQAKMLAGEIALGESTVKRLRELSVNDPDSSNDQIQRVEREIESKKARLCVLEQRIKGEAPGAHPSCSDMHQTVEKLMAQCSEKSFELEIKSADNRILQEQLQKKISDNEALVEKVNILQQQLAKFDDESNAIEELKNKFKIQEYENQKLKTKLVKLVEENTELRLQNQKVAEEAAYAKKLASAAAVELKNLANEVTKLSNENKKLEKKSLASIDHVQRNSCVPNVNGYNHNHSDPTQEQKSLPRSGYDKAGHESGDFKLDQEHLRKELQERIQKEAALEAELVEKRILQDEFMEALEQAAKREQALENDLANMRVIVAKLKKQGTDSDTLCGIYSERRENGTDVCLNQTEESHEHLKGEAMEEPLDVLSKAQMKGVSENGITLIGNTDANSHVCRLCLESAAATVLLPCRHLCLCKSCSMDCTECPICHNDVADRLFIFPS